MQQNSTGTYLLRDPEAMLEWMKENKCRIKFTINLKLVIHNPGCIKVHKDNFTMMWKEQQSVIAALKKSYVSILTWVR